VLLVSIDAHKSDKVLRHAIKCPTGGPNDMSTSLYIRGWVLGAQLGVQAVRFQLTRPHEPMRVDFSAESISRPDVLKAYPSAPNSEFSGFDVTIDLLGMPLTFTIDLSAVFTDGSEKAFASLHVERKCPYIPSACQRTAKSLLPIAVTSLGRSGSTWLMRLLSCHPEVVTYNKYPYEAKVNSSNMLALKSLQLLPSGGVAAFANDALWRDSQLMKHGSNLNVEDRPSYLDLLKREAAHFHMKAVEEFYKEAARRQHKASPRYFAEKYPGGADSEWELWPGMKEVVLVRDFRDVACSALAFNQKRASVEFDRDKCHTDEDYIRYMREKGAARLLDRWKRISAKAYLVKYEDLVLKPEESLAGLFAYLGIDCTTGCIADVLAAARQPCPELEFHRTSESPERSVGRWKTDMQCDLARLATEQFGPILEQLGYHDSLPAR
jgi:hypothetical protein